MNTDPDINAQTALNRSDKAHRIFNSLPAPALANLISLLALFAIIIIISQAGGYSSKPGIPKQSSAKSKHQTSSRADGKTIENMKFAVVDAPEIDEKPDKVPEIRQRDLPSLEPTRERPKMIIGRGNFLRQRSAPKPEEKSVSENFIPFETTK